MRDDKSIDIDSISIKQKGKYVAKKEEYTILIITTTGWFPMHVPTALLLNEDVVRIYYAPRNSEGRSIPTYIDVSAKNPEEVLYIHDKPVLEPGELGTFDDGGIMLCSVVRLSETCIYLYYVGWNASVLVPYRNAIGLAISYDNGETFEKAFPGAIVERNRDEPFFTAVSMCY
jgi:hypothetical protein